MLISCSGGKLLAVTYHDDVWCAHLVHSHTIILFQSYDKLINLLLSTHACDSLPLKSTVQTKFYVNWNKLMTSIIIIIKLHARTQTHFHICYHVQYFKGYLTHWKRPKVVNYRTLDLNSRFGKYYRPRQWVQQGRSTQPVSCCWRYRLEKKAAVYCNHD